MSSRRAGQFKSPLPLSAQQVCKEKLSVYPRGASGRQHKDDGMLIKFGLIDVCWRLFWSLFPLHTTTESRVIDPPLLSIVLLSNFGVFFTHPGGSALPLQCIWRTSWWSVRIWAPRFQPPLRPQRSALSRRQHWRKGVVFVGSYNDRCTRGVLMTTAINRDALMFQGPVTHL